MTISMKADPSTTLTKPKINAFSFCLKDAETAALEISSEGIFRVNGRVVTRDAEIYHSLVQFFSDSIEQKQGKLWNVVADAGHPALSTIVWYYTADGFVNYGMYLGDNEYSGIYGGHSNVTHWMMAPPTPPQEI